MRRPGLQREKCGTAWATLRKIQDGIGKVEIWNRPGYSGENIAQPELRRKKPRIACAKRREKLDSLDHMVEEVVKPGLQGGIPGTA